MAQKERTEAARARIFHAAICALLGAAFVIVGARHLEPPSRLPPWLPYHTSDYYLRTFLRRDWSSERLQQTLAALPKDGPFVAVYLKEDAAGELLAFLVSYLAWPREVRLVPLRAGDSANQPPDAAGVFYCRVEAPPDASARVRLGDGLVVAPGSESKKEAR